MILYGIREHEEHVSRVVSDHRGSRERPGHVFLVFPTRPREAVVTAAGSVRPPLDRALIRFVDAAMTGDAETATQAFTDAPARQLQQAGVETCAWAKAERRPAADLTDDTSENAGRQILARARRAGDRMTGPPLPHDLERMLRTGGLAETQPGVFRRPPVPARMPSRAEPDPRAPRHVRRVVNATPQAADHGAAPGSEAGRGALLGPPATPAATPTRGAGPIQDDGTGTATHDRRPQ